MPSQSSSFAGKRALVAGIAIDSLGSGMYVPFTLVFFLHVTKLPLPEIGLVLTITGLAGVAAVPLAGATVDRFGARRVQLGLYIIRGAGFAFFPLARGLPLFAVLALVTAVSTRAFPATMRARIAELVDGEERDKIQALTRSWANAGLGAGALAASLLIAVGNDSGYVAAAWLNAASFALAAVLAAQTPAGVSHVSQGQFRNGGSYRVVVNDRPYLGLVVANLLLALGYATLSLLFPIYAISWLHVPSGLVGTSFIVNTALCATLGVPVAALARRLFTTRNRAAAAGAVLFIIAFIGQIVLGTVRPHRVSLLMVALIAIVIISSIAEMVHSAASGVLAQSAAPVSVRGRYLAAYQVAWSLAYALAPYMFTVLVSIDGRLPWLVVTVAVALGAALLLLTERFLPAEAVFPRLPAPAKQPVAVAT